MIFKKEKWFQSMNTERRKIFVELCDGALDASFVWWNKFNGVKVYPVEETPGYYTDETGKYLFMAKWCEEEEKNANSEDRTEDR